MINWKKHALGDVLEYTQPSHFIVNNTEYNPEFQIPVLTPGKSFILGYTNEQEGIYDRLPTIIFDDFTTAFKYVDFPFKVKSSAMKMLNTTSIKFDIKFIYYLMQTINFEAKEHKRYWISKYSQLQVRIPPLEEQKKIAAILAAADNYRQKTKALIDKYDRLSQSLFLDMFGDPVTNPKGWDKSLIRNVAEAKNGYAFKSTDYLEKGVPLIRMSNFNNGPVEIKDTIKVSNVFLESRKNFILQNNDFVIALSGATTGKYGIYQHDFPSLLNQRIGLIRAKPVVSVTYLHEFLKLKSNEILKMAAGAAQPNVSLKEIQEITIPVPPLYLQNRFATSLNNIKSQKQQAEASLVKAEELFNSLLQKAFKGELTNQHLS